MKKKIGKDGFEILPPEEHDDKMDKMFQKVMMLKHRNPLLNLKRKMI